MPDPTPDDLRAIYSAASHYLRTLYADQPSEQMHHAVPRS